MQIASDVDREPAAGALWLQAEGARAEIALRGAELRSWRTGGHELIWAPDPAVWADTAPILFPVVGWTRGAQVRVGARRYPLGLHGFARHAAFTVAARDATSVRLNLASSAATLALYPFDFLLHVTYRLGATDLCVAVEVENAGPGAMPYACGVHPGFRWPFAGGAPTDYTIEFAAAERPEVPIITADGLFASARRRIPLQGRLLRLSPELFAAEALCILDANSRGLSFGPKSGPRLCVQTEDFRHFALWSRPGAPFLAIEAWTGHGDPEGYDGDLSDKPSMTILPPGGRATHKATFRLDPAEVVS